MESFWSRVQVELLDRQVWSTRLELATALFEYLEIFHTALVARYADADRLRDTP